MADEREALVNATLVALADQSKAQHEQMVMVVDLAERMLKRIVALEEETATLRNTVIVLEQRTSPSSEWS